MSGKKFHVSRVVWGVPLVLVALLAFAFFQSKSAGPTAALADEPLVASVGSGGAVSVEAPIKVVLSDLPQATAAELQSGATRPHTGPDAEYAARKQSALTPDKQQPLEPAMGEPALLNNPVELLSPGRHYGWYGIPATGWTPSDMAVASGPIYVVQVVNESIAVYTRSGVVQAGYPKTLQAFLCGGCGNSLFDPRAFFDWTSRRYVVIVDRSNGAATSSFYIAASQTSNPLGAWNIYQITFGAAGDFGDYPTLGYDWQGIYSCFSNFAPSFVGNKCYLMPKAKIYAGLGFSYWWQSGFNVGGVQMDTIQPVKTMENDKPRAEFLVNTFNILSGGGQCVNGCSGVVVWSISNPFGYQSGGPNPVFSGWVVPTATYSMAPNANAIGCPNCIDTLDTRISAVPTYHAGSIWAAITTKVGNPAHAGIRWWEIGVALNDNGGGCAGAYVNYCPTLSNAYLKQQGLHYYSTSDAFLPAIQPDDENNVVMVFAYSASNRNPSSVYAGRRINYTLNTFHDGGNYAAVGGGTRTTSSRWGDYFDTSVDQAYRPFRMWFAAQVSTGTNSWTTHVDQTSFYYPNWP